MYSFCEIYFTIFFLLLSLFELQWTIWLAQWGTLLLLRVHMHLIYKKKKKHKQNIPMYITNGRVFGDPEQFDILVISNLSISEQTIDRALKIHTEL